MSTCQYRFGNALRLGVFALLAVVPLQVKGDNLTFSISDPVLVTGNKYCSDVTLLVAPSNATTPTLASFILGFSSNDPNFVQFEDASDEVPFYLFENNSTFDSPYTETASILLGMDPGPPPFLSAGDLYSAAGGVSLTPGSSFGMTRVYFDYAPNETPTLLSVAMITDNNDPNFLSFTDPGLNSLVSTLSDNGNGTYVATLTGLTAVPEPSSLMMGAVCLAAVGASWLRKRLLRADRSCD